MRVIQPAGKRGSLKWIQRAVNHRPELLQPSALPCIDWRSPLTSDDHAEYRDAAFLDVLGLGHLAEELSRFWPRRGPQWDALGVCAAGPVLVEAKAHLAELQSPPSKAAGASRHMIDAAFRAVQSGLGIDPENDWTRTYYQLANRIAHLWWLRDRGVPASLLLVSFLGDEDMNGPAEADTWHSAFDAVMRALGLGDQTELTNHIHHMAPDTRLLRCA
ncbi:hypothetical protein [Sagittula salina]|uniref:Uncharacterized protein n=1 Tax=Sagittula salina TaxID=2820268 RepID=A0A940ML28_9RHOB|nr:hypothetical protein [Sagittula salina]MBP0483476.1 hypothetical protein [Sagittula salina]